jgi:hypothetical protein
MSWRAITVQHTSMLVDTSGCRNHWAHETLDTLLFSNPPSSDDKGIEELHDW